MGVLDLSTITLKFFIGIVIHVGLAPRADGTDGQNSEDKEHPEENTNTAAKNESDSATFPRTQGSQSAVNTATKGLGVHVGVWVPSGCAGDLRMRLGWDRANGSNTDNGCLDVGVTVLVESELDAEPIGEGNSLGLESSTARTVAELGGNGWDGIGHSWGNHSGACETNTAEYGDDGTLGLRLINLSTGLNDGEANPIRFSGGEASCADNQSEHRKLHCSLSYGEVGEEGEFDLS